MAGGLAVGIAMHGHPAALALAALLVASIVRPAPNGAALSLSLAVAGLVLPFTPWLADQARRGWPDVQGVASYGQSAFAQIASVPRVLTRVCVRAAQPEAIDLFTFRGEASGAK